MKTLASLAILTALGAAYFHHQPTVPSAVAEEPPPAINRSVTVNNGDARSVGALQRRGLNANVSAGIPTVQLESSAMRKFEVTIKQVVPGGAIALACFYDLPPSTTTTPERLDWRDRKWTQAGTIFIVGIPAGVIDGQEWKGWLTREGTQTYATLLGSKTVPSYRYVAAPAPVAAKPGGWMTQHGRTALDR